MGPTFTHNPWLILSSDRTSTCQVEDAKGGFVGHQDVHLLWDVAVVVPRHAVTTPGVPASTPNLETHHLDVGDLKIYVYDINKSTVEYTRSSCAPMLR